MILNLANFELEYTRKAFYWQAPEVDISFWYDKKNKLNRILN